jgi:hypothetical protein
MSRFSNEEVKSLQELFQSEFGLEVSPEEAGQHMAQFLDLILATYKDNEPPP